MKIKILKTGEIIYAYESIDRDGDFCYINKYGPVNIYYPEDIERINEDNELVKQLKQKEK